ncbi:MAG: hypothetical protein SWH61_12330 [Thermodesulfobacteriota bacterium]|nr:hypothetical protein [Thermodesulfobacteriota bacterium]
MKRILGIFVAVMMVIGIAGPAAAYFEQNSLHFVAYEEQDNSVPIEATEGTVEMHYDMGNVTNDWYMPFAGWGGTLPASGTTWNTGITIGDFDTDDWSDIYVGLYGVVNTLAPYTFVGVAEDNFNVNTGSASEFSTLVNTTAYGDANQTVEKTKLTTASYTSTGLGEGAYCGLIDSPDSAFNAELNLDADGNGVMGFYYVNRTAGASSLVRMGDIAASVEGGVLMLEFVAVPIPGSLLLLGSGLMGLLGIRRRKVA